MKPDPHFIIIGAMKCATSTLQKQLALQPGIFMTTPKEPNFFSNDDIYSKGFPWYQELFNAKKLNDLTGEASTHYTKLPTYPLTTSRLKNYFDAAPKLIYIMRHPIDRLVSHYIHEWSQGNVKEDINSAVKTQEILTMYSMYHHQIEPFIKLFGKENILPMFYERIIGHPDEQLKRAAEFIGYDNPTKWIYEETIQNASSQRIKKFPGYNLLIDNKIMASIRKAVIPKQLRNFVRSKLTLNERPKLTEENLRVLTTTFDRDLAQLSNLLGITINCKNFKQVADRKDHAWT